MSPGMKIDIILLVIFLLCVWIGAKRGIFKAVSGIIGSICGLIGAFKLSPIFIPYVTKIVTPFFKGAIGRAAEASGISDALTSVVSPQTEEKLRVLLEFLKVPDTALNAAVETAQQSGEKIASAAGGAMAAQFAPIITFILLFLIINMAISLLLPLLGSNLPIIRTANALLGGGLGALLGAVIVIALCWGIKEYSPQDMGGFISISAAEQSRIGGAVLKILQ